jgi:hypothetical protein
MEAMYTLGLNIHIVGVLILLGVVMFNVATLSFSKDIHAYARRMRIVMPISSSLLFLLLFTGAIMMAAKHLVFNPTNILMIVGIVVIIALEIKRYRALRYQTNILDENALELYKTKGFRYLGIELAILLTLSAWMIV